MNLSFNKKICYWSIAWGQHTKMLKYLVQSFKNVGMKEDFISFSDSVIPYATKSYGLIPEVNLTTSNYLFKLEYLQFLRNLDYDYFIFLDADTVFVKKPELDAEFFVSDFKPWFSFLEGPINSFETKRLEWWGVPNLKIEENFRSTGVISKEIRNMNAGFWICKKDFISQALYLSLNCYKDFVKQGYKITEEIPMAYLTNYFYPDNNFFYIEKYPNYWCSDWVGIFNNQIPTDKSWTMLEYMTGRNYTVQPAIVHAMRSDQALISSS